MTNTIFIIAIIALFAFMMMRKGGCCGGHRDKKSETDVKKNNH